MPSFSHLQSVARVEDRRCHAARTAIRRAATSRTPTADPTAITIRLAAAEDADRLATLAQLDSATVPQEPVLIAEEGGRLRAAISLRDGSAIADPFHRTAAILQLLSARAAHLRADEPTRARRIRGLVARAVATAR